MRRVVVTGMGIVSCLGNTIGQPYRSACATAVSGIRAVPEYAELGLRSQVAGVPQIDLVEAIDRKLKRFMGDAAAYAYVAMRSAHGGRRTGRRSRSAHPRIGVVAGSGGGSPQWQIETGRPAARKGRAHRSAPFMVPRTMCSTVSATLATAFGILGLSYSISAACATSAHCIGAGRRPDPARRAGRGVRRRRRGAALGHDRAVRRHGRAVQPPQRHARERPRGPTTPAATASSSAAVAACWCWRTTSTPGPAARASMPNWSATA